MATMATTIPVCLRNEATGRYLGAAADRSCYTAEHAGDALVWEMERAGDSEGCWALRSAAVGGLVLEGAIWEMEQREEGCWALRSAAVELQGAIRDDGDDGVRLRLSIPSLVGDWLVPLTDSGGPDGGAGECTFDHTGGGTFVALPAPGRLPSAYAAELADRGVVAIEGALRPADVTRLRRQLGPQRQPGAGADEDDASPDDAVGLAVARASFHPVALWVAQRTYTRPPHSLQQPTHHAGVAWQTAQGSRTARCERPRCAAHTPHPPPCGWPSAWARTRAGSSLRGWRAARGGPPSGDRRRLATERSLGASPGRRCSGTRPCMSISLSSTRARVKQPRVSGVGKCRGRRCRRGLRSCGRGSRRGSAGGAGWARRMPRSDALCSAITDNKALVLMKACAVLHLPIDSTCIYIHPDARAGAESSQLARSFASGAHHLRQRLQPDVVAADNRAQPLP